MSFSDDALELFAHAGLVAGKRNALRAHSADDLEERRAMGLAAYMHANAARGMPVAAGQVYAAAFLRLYGHEET